MADETAPPAESEGADASGGLYDLDSVPEDQRSLVEPHLKAIEANITKKLQENADYRKRWEPYDEIGVTDIDPQALQQLIQFAEMTNDESQFEQWFRSIGEDRGWLDSSTADDLDLDLDEGEELTAEKVEQMLAKAMEPVNQSLQEREAKEAEQAATAEITATLDALKAEHGDDLDTDAILQLAYAYADEDPDNAITRGFEDYRRLVGKGEADLFAKKVSQPEAPEGPGRANTAPEQITTFEQAKAAALDRIKADQAA